ncbi:MAG: hypothetical protein ACYC3I_15655 [Gemmataceae bacterium]
MNTATKSRQRVKPERRVRVIMPIRDNYMGSIEIKMGKEQFIYGIMPMKSDFGVAFRLIESELIRQPDNTFELHDTDRYDVLLNGEQSTCECKGFLGHGHCKHVDGLTTLRQRNLI